MPEATVQAEVNPFRVPAKYYCLEEHRWDSILQPYLENALISQGQYTTEEINSHLDFFRDCVSGWLGHGPIRNNDTGAIEIQFPSSLTNDHTPFELSLCWKGKQQKGRPVVRYVSDVIPPGLETSRMAAFNAALDVIERLEEAAANTTNGLGLRIYPELRRKVTKEMIEVESKAHYSTACSRCSPSGVFVAFDLVASEAFGKFYWLFPVCLEASHVCHGITQTLESCIEVEPEFASVLQPRMLSIDTTKYPQSRVEVYVRCIFHNTNGFEDLEPHLTLGGTICPPESFRETCRALWTSLTSQGEDIIPGIRPKYCLLMYDLPASASQKMSAKLYVMCQEIPRVVSFIARCLNDSCPVLQDADIIKQMSRSLDPAAYFCEIGLAPRGRETEVSIYYSPSYLSQLTWRDAVDANGYLKKKRRVIPTKPERLRFKAVSISWSGELPS